jgi:hypothetical protein
MLVITALVGTRDLGQEVYIALTKADTGRGLVAGLSIAAIAIIADRLISAAPAMRAAASAWSKHDRSTLLDRIRALPCFSGSDRDRAADRRIEQ